MEARLQFDILPQPDDTTCGPTCLHAIYRYFGDEIPLSQVIREVPSLCGGGTLGVMLGSHALARGYKASLYTSTVTVLSRAAGVKTRREAARTRVPMVDPGLFVA